jgi:hypothetical protein
MSSAVVCSGAIACGEEGVAGSACAVGVGSTGACPGVPGETSSGAGMLSVVGDGSTRLCGAARISGSGSCACSYLGSAAGVVGGVPSGFVERVSAAGTGVAAERRAEGRLGAGLVSAREGVVDFLGDQKENIAAAEVEHAEEPRAYVAALGDEPDSARRCLRQAAGTSSCTGPKRKARESHHRSTLGECVFDRSATTPRFSQPARFDHGRVLDKCVYP